MSDHPADEVNSGGYDGYLLDLDGTLHRGKSVIGGAPETVERLRATGLPVRFVTNNAARTADDVAARLRRLGFRADPAEVYASSHAAATMLAGRLPKGARVLVLGTEALAARIRDAGMRSVREAGPGIDAVVQGHNPDTGWRQLAEACVAIRAGAWWVACNTDATLPSERGELPGNGAMITALRTATGVEPDVAGKPREPLLALAAQESGCADPLVVGDRLETDIAGARAAGMDSLLVLSGVGTPGRLLAAGAQERPRYVAADVTVLPGSLAELEIGGRRAPCPAWRVERDGAVLVVATGSGAESPHSAPDAVCLLRALCDAAWSEGVTATRADDARAREALSELGLPSS